jgi:hypothetical protein
MPLSITAFMLTVVYAECRKSASYSEGQYAELRYAECGSAHSSCLYGKFDTFSVILLHVSKHFVIVASLLNKSSTIAQALCVTIFANMQTDMILVTFCFAT